MNKTVNAPFDTQRSISVSASAGSGKTWQLVSRITRLLLDGVSPDRILALTFTRKAATEMRERVEARLQQMALTDDTTLDALLAELNLTPTAALRSHARGLYERVLFSPWPLRANTLHVFCQSLVARFPEQTGLAADFELVASETDVADEAWQAVQRRVMGNPSGAESQALDALIAAEFSEFSLRETVHEFLAQRSDWRCYTRDADDPVAYAVQRLRDQLQLDDNPLSRLHTDIFVARLRDMCRLVARAGNIGKLRSDALTPALEQQGEARFQTLRKALLRANDVPCQFEPSDKAHKILGADIEALLRAHDVVIAALLHIIEQQRRAATLQRTTAALTLGAAALHELDRLNRERQQLTFSDLEWLAYRLLTDEHTAHWAQFKLDQRVDHLLLDEFQDTSNLQWRLLLPLLQEMAAGDPERERSLFIVGDIKQSIYGFRSANPDLLPAATAWMHEQLNGQSLTLAQSFRSTPAVIQWVNALFDDPALLPDFPKHETARKGWGRVEWTAAVQADSTKTQATEFRNPLLEGRHDPEERRAKIEAQQIAERIRTLVAARWAIEEDGAARALDYGDILILLRQRTQAYAIEEALTNAGIPFVGETRGTLLDTLEARDLLALLRALLSPTDDLSLAHALRSPVFDVGDEDLIHLATQSRDTGHRWFTVLRAQAHSPTLQRAAQLLERWHGLAQRLPAHDLLDRLCNEGDLAQRYEQSLPPAAAARARGNLNAVIQLALTADSGRYPSLSAFIETLEHWVNHKDAPNEAPVSGGQRHVRIMTVHAAKGLEAPAVFIAQSAAVKQSSSKGWIVEWPANQDAPTHFLLAPVKAQLDALSETLIQRRDERERIENLNLLYVAVTRARQFLHISGYASKQNSAATHWHTLAQRAFGRLGVADENGVAVFAEGEPQIATTPTKAPAPSALDPRLRQPLRTRTQRAASEAVQDINAVRRGQAIHWLIQQMSEGRDQALRGALEAQITGAIRDTDFNEWITEARAVCAAPALHKFFDATQYRRAWNEITLPQDSTLGVMDRLVDDGETLWVLDYKTQRDGNDAQLLARHRAQLDGYRDGVRQLWPGRQVRAGLVLTDSARWLEFLE